jgi:hypothetical protein
MMLRALVLVVLLSVVLAEPPRAAFAPRGQDSPLPAPPSSSNNGNNERSVEGSEGKAVGPGDERMRRGKRFLWNLFPYYGYNNGYYNGWNGGYCPYCYNNYGGGYGGGYGSGYGSYGSYYPGYYNSYNSYYPSYSSYYYG